MRIIGGKHRGTKLKTLDGLNTRPTLDRVKEPLFSILQFDLQDAIVLDLFSGSGALGLEAISRGAKKVFLCDKSIESIHIIEQNVEKLKSNSEIQILHQDFIKCLEALKNKKETFDIIFLDPPYSENFVEISCEKIIEFELLKKSGKIIIETDRENEIIEKIDKIKELKIYDKRKYGRVSLIFLIKN